MTNISGVPSPRGQIRRPNRRFRVIFGLSVVALIVFIVSLRGIAGFYTDYLWFNSLDFAQVWKRVVLTKVSLSLIFILFTFLLLWINLFIADRIAPRSRPEGPEEAFDNPRLQQLSKVSVLHQQVQKFRHSSSWAEVQGKPESKGRKNEISTGIEGE